MEHNPARMRASWAAALLRLAAGLLLLPLLGSAQQQPEVSSIEVGVLTGPNAPTGWALCGTTTFAGFVNDPLTTPSIPTAGGRATFRIRKDSTQSSSESVELPDLDFAEPFSQNYEQRSLTSVQFTSSPELPATLPPGTQIFTIGFTPPEAGIYRFEFLSNAWDGGSCTVEIQVEETQPCLITAINGLPPAGSAAPNTPNLLDFGIVPVGESPTRMLGLSFSQSISQQEPIEYTPLVDEHFLIADDFVLLSGGLQATWNVTFTPDTTGPFEDSRRFYAMRDQLNPACFIDVVLRGQGALPELSITYGDPECGGTLRVPVTLRNESALRLDALDARATSGYALSPDPPGSFSAISFSLGPEGSVNPPAERQFILRYPLAAPNPASPSITVRQTTSVLKTEAIPAYGCIEIVEPSALTLDFGDVVVNTAAPGQSIRLANRGNAAASVTARLTTAGQGFGLGAQGAGSQTLNVPPISDTTTLPVSFLPPAPGPKQSAVSFTSAAPGSIPNVNLLGAGVDQPTVSLSFEAGGTRVSPGGTIRLPSTEVGQTSAAIPFVIRNDGGLAASNLGVTVSGSEFLISDSTPPQLLPGQSMDYALTFRPAQTGRRGGMLTVMGSNLANTIQFALEGDGVMGAITVNGIGLSANVVPAQTPLPTVGLELAGGAAQQTILGDLMLEFIPNLPQAPPAGFAEAYQAVRFMAGGGSGGRTIGFQFSQGQQRAVFSAEQQAGADAQAARFQTGTVAGTLRFQAINLRTSDGSSVNVADPIVGSVSVERLAPSIRSLNTPATGTGVNVVVESVSTTREITGVCLALNAAAGADLSFTRPDATFLNTNFSQWFSSNPSFAHGGAFSLTIPIDISNSSTFGSAQVWLRNSQGWSAPNSPCP